MSINDPSQIHYIANVRVPGGANNISLDEDEVQRYRTDPDGFVGETFGLSKLEYIEWVELDGTPLCSHRTKGGDLCRNATSRATISVHVEGGTPKIRVLFAPGVSFRAELGIIRRSISDEHELLLFQSVACGF